MTTPYKHLTLSGDLGSGKTSVAARLRDRLGMAGFSTGEMHRQIAAELGQSALEANRTAETDASIDRRIDGMTVKIGQGDEPTIFDSRMAWRMVEDALRVHLLAEPTEAARRVLGRAATAVEGYADLAAAAEGLKERASVERRRFSAKYGVDILALRNYDLVVDTTGIEVDEVVDLVAREFERGRVDRSKLWANPARIQDQSGTPLPLGLADYIERIAANARPGVLNVFYVAPELFVLLDPDAELLTTLQDGRPRLVEANLLADAIDAKDAGIYLRRAISTEPADDVLHGLLENAT